MNAHDFTGAKVALDASTDQALAGVRNRRLETNSHALLGAAGYLAGVIAEQFPEDRRAAGRVVMAVAQFVSSLENAGPGQNPVMLAAVLGLAAEQVVREAGEQP